ncbi:MAG TPA: hypothetical protein VEG08_01365 [Terriglobales bacterium]|nr:hypothetical protein [Terriglobales bacterium]
MPLACLCQPDPPDTPRRPALVIGHPGHELRLFGWVAEYRPRVYVLTDGSGRGGVSRLPSTARLFAALGAEPGELFGALSDAELYRALLAGNTALFLGLLDRLADSFVRHRIDFVAGDASEGYNPAHDLCRALIDAAARMVQDAAGAPANYEFRLTERRQSLPEVHDRHCWHLSLDDALLQRKLQAAHDYVEMREEVRDALALYGEEYFRVECLRRVPPAPPAVQEGKPFYETWGEQRVAAGDYASVIRWREHMLPVLEALFEHAACAPRPS